MQIIGAGQLMILGSTVFSYVSLIAVRRLFPRRYFEFQIKKRKMIRRGVLNAKI
jgi:hypothetical protein